MLKSGSLILEVDRGVVQVFSPFQFAAISVYVAALTAPVVVFLIWKRETRELGIFLVCLIVFISFTTSIPNVGRHLLFNVSAPVFFIALISFFSRVTCEPNRKFGSGMRGGLVLSTISSLMYFALCLAHFIFFAAYQLAGGWVS